MAAVVVVVVVVAVVVVVVVVVVLAAVIVVAPVAVVVVVVVAAPFPPSASFSFVRRLCRSSLPGCDPHRRRIASSVHMKCSWLVVLGICLQVDQPSSPRPLCKYWHF